MRKFFIGGLLALIFAAPAAAQRTTLMPGVTYEPSIQFTPHGPVAMHVVIGPRPTGLYALRPTLSNESILGLEKVTAMQKRLSASATMVGINGDFYAPDTGRPSGVLMRDGVVDSPPSGDRSSVGLSPEGAIDIRRVEFFGTWRGLGQRRTLTDMNQAPRQNAISLFTPATAPRRRLRQGSRRSSCSRSAGHTEHRSDGNGRRVLRRRRHADSARRRRARRTRDRGGAPRRRRPRSGRPSRSA